MTPIDKYSIKEFSQLYLESQSQKYKPLIYEVCRKTVLFDFQSAILI